MEGLGVMKMTDQRKYDGDFKEDNRHGWGRMEWPDGKVYEG